MDLKAYQDETKKTAVYPAHEQKGYYPILALCGEAGELANNFKKVLRGDYDQNDPKYLIRMGDELGDCLWYIARIAEDLGFDLNTIAKFNLKKLRSRKAAGRLKRTQ